MKVITTEKRNLNKRSRALRKAGLIPGIIFGNSMKNTPITISRAHLEKQLKEKAVIYNTKINDKKINIVLQEIQRDPVTHEIIHVSLLNVPRGIDTTVETPVNFTNEAQGVRNGGVLQIVTDAVQVTGMPSKIPGELICDVSNLDIGDKVTVSDLIISQKGIEISEEDNKVLAVCLPPTTEDKVEATENTTKVLKQGPTKEEAA